MRKIKFRGIAFHNMEFVYGDLCHSQRCPQIIVNGNGVIIPQKPMKKINKDDLELV